MQPLNLSVFANAQICCYAIETIIISTWNEIIENDDYFSTQNTGTVGTRVLPSSFKGDHPFPFARNFLSLKELPCDIAFISLEIKTTSAERSSKEFSCAHVTAVFVSLSVYTYRKHL